MDIQANNYSISEVLGMLNRGELKVNSEYQRGSGIWPNGARSYFIETILSKYPFPKVYFYEYYDRIRGEMRKELVDGQQRISSINDYVAGKFSVSGDSPFSGKRFDDLDDEQVQNFMSYTVSADVVRNATRGEILQMFRRMNAFTLPLNNAEKRHSSFQGAFKWFINDVTDALGDFLSRETFTDRQMVRMADAELISEIVLAFESGIVSTSPAELNNLYKKYDNEFPKADFYKHIIIGQFRKITEKLPGILSSHMMKPYALQSLIVCLAYIQEEMHEISQQISVARDGPAIDWERAEGNLQELSRAHEARELEGPHRLYVWGCTEGTNRAGRRLARMSGILGALNRPVRDVTDVELAKLLPKQV